MLLSAESSAEHGQPGYSHAMEVKQYRGRLTPAQAAEGINAANANARRLAEDAQALFDRGSFATAASLAILAVEEKGKAGILRMLLIASSDDDLREEWKRYRRHTEKNQFLLILDMLRCGARKLSDFRELFTEETASARRAFDLVKQFGFYTDCCGDNVHWATPTEAIDEDFASLMVRIAHVITRDEHRVTAREMELWAEYTRGGVSEQSLLAWCEAVQAEGLHPHGYADRMMEFVQRGIAPTPKPH
jgi:AbiV family abortive infection protein